MSAPTTPAPPRRRVLVVDDSTFMRMVLRRIIEAGSELTVVGEARNGREAVDLARDLKPDIITMDVEMPELDGLAAMKQILAGPPPKPVMIMVSGHTQRGTETTIKALSLGAVDFVSKSSSFVTQDLGHVLARMPFHIKKDEGFFQLIQLRHRTIKNDQSFFLVPDRPQFLSQIWIMPIHESFALLLTLLQENDRRIQRHPIEE